MTMDEIGALVRDYAAAKDAMEAVTEEVRVEQRKVVNRKMKSIRGRVTDLSVTRERLSAAISENRGLFADPRTQSLHGVKFGLRKQPGSIGGSPAEILARIDRRLPDRAEELTRTSRTIDKRALMRLSAADLAKVGATLVQDADKVVIETPASDLDKWVEALLKEVDEIVSGSSS